MGTIWFPGRCTRRWLVCYIDRHGLVERLDLSPLGLLVAAAGRLGQRLRTEPADDHPRGRPDAVRDWRTGAAWLYLCTTLVPTVAVVPAGLVRGALAWRLAAGCVGPVAMLVLMLAYAWAAPALDVRRRQVVGGTERGMLRAGHAAVCAVRQARPDLDVLADPVPPAVLDQALWDLAGVLVAGERARTAQRRVRAALDRLAADEPLAGELRSRQAALTRAQRALRTEAARRLASLRAVAASCRQLVAECEAVNQGSRAASAADAVLLSLTPPGPAQEFPQSRDGPVDPAAGPAELMSATLEAYRQLWREGRRQDSPRSG
ncbi:MAG TPA: hypothetical protein VGP31_17165 [Planosporangium sp.]|jgi:hypothetical protein|nr:hypothetical protein [Planosporangium sp.]